MQHCASRLFCVVVVVAACALLVAGAPICDDATPYWIPISQFNNEHACRPCDPQLRPDMRGGVSNCYCNAGEYCTSRGNDNAVRSAVYGTCTPYTILGAPCVVQNDCKTTTTDIYDNTVTDQFLFCVQGFCRECYAEQWAQQTSQAGSALTYTCPGHSGSADSDQLSSHPGETRTCGADDALVYGGTLDYNLGIAPSGSGAPTPTRTRNANTTPSSTASLTSTPTSSLSTGASPSVSPSIGAEDVSSAGTTLTTVALVLMLLTLICACTGM